ncbi:MAG: hypothetical protein ACLUVF_08885 [Adlercreutzia sp.]
MLDVLDGRLGRARRLGRRGIRRLVGGAASSDAARQRRAASPKGVGLVMFGATMSPSGTGQPAASAATATARALWWPP